MSVDTVTWTAFKSEFRWRQGEHIAIVAPTEAGKTTLVRELMPLRSHIVFFGTKLDDPLYRKLIKVDGFRRVESIDDVKPWDKKILLWPKHCDTIDETYAKQKRVFKHALDVIVKQRAWTVIFDECKYMAEQLGLGRQVTFCLEQLRTIKGTTVSGAQRPVWLPRSVLANASHAFFWKTTDPDDAKRLSDMGGLDSKMLRNEMMTLGAHEWIYVHTRGTEKRILRSQVRTR